MKLFDECKHSTYYQTIVINTSTTFMLWTTILYYVVEAGNYKMILLNQCSRYLEKFFSLKYTIKKSHWANFSGKRNRKAF